MKSSGVIALVAAGVVVGGGAATYELTRPASGSVQVNYVNPASQPTTSTPTTVATTSAPKPSPTSTTTAKTAVAVTSSSTTHKATVRKEATVSQPQETTAQPSATTTTPPAPDDPIRSVAPRPTPGNFTQGPPTSNAG